MLRTALGIMVCTGLAGCFGTTPKYESIASDITLGDALIQVRDGLNSIKRSGCIEKECDSRKPDGLVVSEVQVVFNVTASNKETNKLAVDIAPSNIVKEIPSIKYEKGGELNMGRGNQITVKFQNLFLASKDTLVGLSIAPSSVVTEKSVVTDKDGKTTITEKIPDVKTPMTLEDLYKFIDAVVDVKGNPVRRVDR